MEPEKAIEVPKLDIEAMLEARQKENQRRLLGKLASVEIGVDI